jgi:hypothetical protein
MWFNNHSRSKQSKPDAFLELEAAPRKKKQLAAYQAYYSLYRHKVSAIIEAEWPDAWRADPERDTNTKNDCPPPVPINFRNRVAKRLLDEESDQVKAEVEAFRTNAGGDDDNSPGTASEDIRELHAEAKAFQECVKSYHGRDRSDLDKRNIERVGATALRVLETILQKAGMVGSIVCAGPEPEQGGNIMVLSYVPYILEAVVVHADHGF